ncbi:MAG: hypothetical protein QXD23_00490 [Candidatus Micrarchaeaceae archaeon]
MYKQKIFRVSTLLSILLFGISYASPILCNSNLLNNNLYSEVAYFSNYAISNAISLSLLGILVSFFFIAIIYIINKVFPEARLGSFITNEYREIVKTILIIVIIYGALSFFSGVAVSLTGASIGSFSTNLGNLLYNSEVYLCNTNNVLTSGAGNLIDVALADGLLKSLVITWGGLPIPPVPLPGIGAFLPVVKSGVEFNLLTNNIFQTDFVSGAQFVTSVMNDIFNNVIFPAVNLITVQISILPLFEIIGLWVLIPLGIVFRALPFIRGIGGTLIAFGIGIALIWPATLVLFNAPVSNFFYSYLSIQGETPVSTCASLGLISSICSGLSEYSYFSPSIALINSGVSSIEPFSLAVSSLFSIYPGLNYILQNSLYIILQVFILFIFDLIIVYTITENIAKTLGGSLNLSLTNKLKLV